MEKEKKIPLKNYIILVLIVFVTVILVIYFCKWFETLKNEKENISIMDNYLTTIQYNEIDNYLAENENIIIYYSYLSSDESSKFERKFIKLIDKYALNDRILYLKREEDKFSDRNGYVYNKPYIIVFENGNVVSRYDIEKNKYDIDSLKQYFIGLGVIDD